VDTVVTGEEDKGTGSTARAVAVLADGANEPGSAIVRSWSRMPPNTAKNATTTSVHAAATKRMAASRSLELSLRPEALHKAS